MEKSSSNFPKSLVRSSRGRVLAPVMLALLVGCSSGSQARMSLGKVVVYRNGIAYFERNTTVHDGKLALSVPQDKVDDFLKSLTIRDAKTGKSLPISFPSRTNQRGIVKMIVSIPTKAPTEVTLTYISESPSWKPSYRVVVADDGKVELEGWAVVDNTSGEDWKNVLVGVGSSSALSFRYDLWSIRQVHRETLGHGEAFAIAPPTGVSPYGSSGGGNQTTVANLPSDIVENIPGTEFDDSLDEAIRSADGVLDAVASRPLPVEMGGPSSKRTRAEYAERVNQARKDAKEAARRRAERKKQLVYQQRKAKREFDSLLRRIQADANTEFVIEGLAQKNDPASKQAALAKANNLRNSLIQNGVAPARIKAVASEGVKGQPESVRVNRVSAKVDPKNEVTGPAQGESHFLSKAPLTVAQNGSAMVSVVKEKTDGTLVYLFDSESKRSNSRYAFKSVRVVNPTDFTLEGGPITVFGEGRFIGEGLSDSIGPKQSVIVPFALDRQVVVTQEMKHEDQIESLASVMRGVVQAEVGHRRMTEYKLKNRLHEPARVYVRHTIQKGWSLVNNASAVEKLGRVHFFPITLAAGEEKTLVVTQSTPILRTLNLRSERDLTLLSRFLQKSAPKGTLAEKVRHLVQLHKDMVKNTEYIRSIERRLRDYRVRLDELHAQVLTLKMVKSRGELMKHLNKKMKQMSQYVQNSTIEIVERRNKQTFMRIAFLDAMSELDQGEVRVATK